MSPRNALSTKARSPSVLTIVRGRRNHLVNLIEGLKRQDLPPAELVIAYMQETSHEGLPQCDFEIKTVHIVGEKMPLAAARNAAAEAASSEKMILLDVDCIPSPGLVAAYDRALSEVDRILISEVFYLPCSTVRLPVDYAELDSIGIPHPAKPRFDHNGWKFEPNHLELWGLAFGITKSNWRRAGGMDEQFFGYGGEETDFAMALEKAGIPLYLLGGARAYHQFHAVRIPPYHHFEDIVRNAQIFRSKWGRLCMEYWLEQFERAGLIQLRPDTIDIICQPTEAMLKAAEPKGDVRFS